MKTEFNKKYPKAFNLKIEGNGHTWGVSFNLPNSNKRQFVSIEKSPNDTEEIVISEVTLYSNRVLRLLREEDSVICQN
jgi:hypothetical protein